MLVKLGYGLSQRTMPRRRGKSLLYGMHRSVLRPTDLDSESKILLVQCLFYKPLNLMRLALIAHDRKKDDMLALAGKHLPLLRQCALVATGTTGGRLSRELCLDVTCVLSGPMGGDQQIGAMLVAGQVQALVFLRDPMTPQPHEPDINALVRACDVHNVPCATNLSTADMLLSSLALGLTRSNNRG
jgi:methylglyoxal synthase